MAITGAILLLFVIGHMLGNLQVFEGPEKLNAYGRFLRAVPELLWTVRAVLLISVALHIWASVQLAARKIRARPVSYAKRDNVASGYASRTMYWSGPIILAFVIYHLLHLTAGVVHPGGQFIEGDCVSQRCVRFSGLVRFGVVHLFDGPAGHAHLAWRVEHVSYRSALITRGIRRY